LYLKIEEGRRKKKEGGFEMGIPCGKQATPSYEFPQTSSFVDKKVIVGGI
jgi:hypothetical protein